LIIYYTDNFAGGREESHRLLGQALAVYTGDEQRAKTLTGALKKGEHGKPFIEGFDSFSISHTGSIWAVLIAESECGLDIQTGRKCDIKAIADRWFAPEDALSIIFAETDQSDAFFRIWTRREALTKALGGTVYDTDIPPVSGEYVRIDGDLYVIRDIQIPGMPDIYAAVCIYNRESISEPDFIRL